MRDAHKRLKLIYGTDNNNLDGTVNLDFQKPPRKQRKQRPQMQL